MANKIIALLGQKQAQADGVVDYCTQLQKAIAKQNSALELVWMGWREKGWLRSLSWLWQESQVWKDRWVIVQFTASAWSKLALPVTVIPVIQLLKLRGVKVAVMFHEVQGYPGERWKYKIRRSVQLWTIRTAMNRADKSIVNVALEQLSWLPITAKHPVFIPVGSNMPEPDWSQISDRKTRQPDAKTVVIFGLTSLEITQQEVEAIAYAIRQAAAKVPNLRLVTLGRGSSEAGDYLRQALSDLSIEIEILGLLEPDRITEILSTSDVQLYVRDEISTRRGTAIAGIACGIPIVAYEGRETAHPIPDAGVLLLPQGNQEALANGLIRVLQDEQLWLELHQRNLHIYQNYLCWDTIAKRFIEELTDE